LKIMKMHADVLENTYGRNVTLKEVEGEWQSDVSTEMAWLGRNGMAEQGREEPWPRQRLPENGPGTVDNDWGMGRGRGRKR
jgi:hypothetical protein